MKWTGILSSCWITASYLLFTWFVVASLHASNMLDISHIDSTVILVSLCTCMLVAFVVIIMIVYVKFGVYRNTFKYILVGLWNSLAILAIGLVVWMPYGGYSWIATTGTTIAAFFVFTLFCWYRDLICRDWFFHYCKYEAASYVNHKRKLKMEVTACGGGLTKIQRTKFV